MFPPTILTTGMKVSKIEPSRHVKGRYLLFFEEDEKACWKVTEKEILDFSLYPGRELSAVEEQALQEAAGISGARARAAGIIGSRALSSKELHRRLVQKGESEENAADAVAWLQDIGALDDLAYAKTVVRHYTASGWGSAKLRDELYRRGVPREFWEEAMESESGDPSEAIDRYLTSKLRGRVPDKKELKRLSDGLRRRGFRWEDIKVALRRLEEAAGEEY
jgi:regulatory protein